jgi:glycosyltransferase involved in cell wall biosynthesis
MTRALAHNRSSVRDRAHEPLISVVIAVRNDAEGLDRTLAALEQQTLPANRFEVIVVDDASTDETPAITAARTGVKLIQLSAQSGSYVARNRGLAQARGSVIAITDAECRPDPHWLERGLSHLAADESAVIGGHITMPLTGRRTLAAMVDVVNHLDQQRYVEDGCAVTANLFASAATFRAVGGFEERLLSSGDVEWTRRAAGAGHRLIYAPDTIVEHPPRSSARALLRKARRTSEGMRMANRQRLLDTKRPYFDARCLIPSHRSRWRVRLNEHGVRPRRLGWVAIGIGQVALVQLPHVLYALAADLRAWASRPIQ